MKSTLTWFYLLFLDGNDIFQGLSMKKGSFLLEILVLSWSSDVNGRENGASSSAIGEDYWRSSINGNGMFTIVVVYREAF